jgi:nucleoside-diphosphate-sugar epimerase
LTAAIRLQKGSSPHGRDAARHGGPGQTLNKDVPVLANGPGDGAAITMDWGVDEMGYRREALDISSAERDLGWQPIFGTEQGIAAYIDWLKGERNKAAATSIA